MQHRDKTLESNGHYSVNSQRLLTLEELRICKYRAIIFKCLKSKKETNVPDRATGETQYIAASYPAISLVMITRESACAVSHYDSSLVQLDFSFKYTELGGGGKRMSVLGALYSLKEKMLSVTHSSLVPLSGKHIKGQWLFKK